MASLRKFNSANRFMIVLSILLCMNPVGNTQVSAVTQMTITPSQIYVKELRLENRLPEWANYVCFQDAENLRTGLFMLIGYQPPTNDPFFANDGNGAKKFGYTRGLTYQEYIGSDTGISAINMPISPEEYEEEIPKGMRGQPISSAAIDMMRAQFIALRNDIAVAKSTIQHAAKDFSIKSKLLKDEETQALLDAPDGTNYRNYVDSHPAFVQSLIYYQKYYDAGITTLPKGFKVYREGNVIFESDFGSDVFEPASSGRKAAGTGLATRIQMQNTAFGLRFLESHSMGGSGIGIPIAGKCEPIARQ